MYADRRRSSAIDPRSLGIAVALNGAALAALLLVQPVFTVIKHDKPFETYPVKAEPPPPPVPPERLERHATQHQSPAAARLLVDPRSPTRPVIDNPLPPQPIDLGPALRPIEPVSLAPVTIAPEVDPAHRGDLQPTYPVGELRAEREGVVTVRVLIGADGRVHQVEQVAATSAAFFDSTRERALAKWRFRPATRGGVPIEAWRTMTIRFVIPR